MWDGQPATLPCLGEVTPSRPTLMGGGAAERAAPAPPFPGTVSVPASSPRGDVGQEKLRAAAASLGHIWPSSSWGQGALGTGTHTLLPIPWVLASVPESSYNRLWAQPRGQGWLGVPSKHLCAGSHVLGHGGDTRVTSSCPHPSSEITPKSGRDSFKIITTQ